MPEAIIRALDLDLDAGPLATMWNESGAAWPNSWPHGRRRLGRTLGSRQEIALGPKATVVYTLFVVACDSADAAVSYTVLKGYAG